MRRKQSDQERLKTLEKSNYNAAKLIFWNHAKKLALKEFKPVFEVDEQNVTAISKFVAYFSNDLETMEKHEVDPNKGIMIFGNPGSGKSMLFRILKECLQSKKIFTCEDGSQLMEKDFFLKTNFHTCEHMAKFYMLKGDPGLNIFGKNSTNNICFDDLGSEEMRCYYGNKKEVMADLINERYDLFLQIGLKSHFTTNLSPDLIEKRYSSRVRSRLKHMCNILSLGTEKNYNDRRQTNGHDSSN